MKVGTIINTITTYKSLQNRLFKYQQEYNTAEAYDDFHGMGKAKTQIENINKEIGQFLDCEV